MRHDDGDGRAETAEITSAPAPLVSPTLHPNERVAIGPGELLPGDRTPSGRDLYELGLRHRDRDRAIAHDAMAFGLMIDGVLTANECRRAIDRRGWD